MTIIAKRRPFVPCSVGTLVAGTLAASLACLSAGPAAAQKVHNTYGVSPLDTLMNTHITTDVPDAKDFVRATSPDKKDLDYTPLTGVEPERPKPRSPAEVKALQAELEGAGARNEQRAKGLAPPKAGRKTKQASGGG